MIVICAPASFKECLSALEVAQAMAAGVQRANPAICCDVCPVGDGGEGTMVALVQAAKGEFRPLRVAGPLGDPVDVQLGVVDGGRCSIVELAQASGLALVPPDQRDPTRTTSFGTGQMIRHAAHSGCQEIIVCIGGSASVDGGTGLAQALGWRFLDALGEDLGSPHMCGGALNTITHIIPPPNSQPGLPRIRVACDVTNQLCGPNGAAAVYGPQKGATPEQLPLLDQGLANLARITGGDPDEPGAGAAGGAGFGLVNFCAATLERGIDLVLDAVKFDDRVRGASLVLTGEGRLDEQSLQGKACLGVAKRAALAGVPTVAIVGSTEAGIKQFAKMMRSSGLDEYISLTERFGQQRAIAEAEQLISQIGAEIALRRKTSGKAK